MNPITSRERGGCDNAGVKTSGVVPEFHAAVVILSIFLVAAACGAPEPNGDARAARTDSSAGRSTALSAAGRYDTAPLKTLLNRHVDERGVDYVGLSRRSTDELDRYLGAVVATDPAAFKEKSERIAFYVNAYNAWTLKKVLDSRPLKSVNDVTGFFSRKDVEVGGERISLNELEAKARREGDPRVHFAVNCASASCPPLSSEPIPGDAAQLDATLEKLTEDYLADRRHGLDVDGDTARVSKIFDWYAEDFAPSGAVEDVLAWIREHAPANRRPALDGVTTVEFKSYDWSLNQR